MRSTIVRPALWVLLSATVFVFSLVTIRRFSAWASRPYPGCCLGGRHEFIVKHIKYEGLTGFISFIFGRLSQMLGCITKLMICRSL